ncbi:hypothetical protein [Mycobacterium sp. 29Ha]|uniref:hypothetical protein n=1 Tax=Mycobacterium sp. 29Ha TaxID=2939268 RepID=UPI0029392946|nr:hypothetical protein [Mycobacterium sp. 29Ha]MDV3135633.1 hypothetical protein [Mycobacterium sp. 29Ha]
MAVKKVDVTVLHGGHVVRTSYARTVRLMPDGYAGIMYDGGVYPLYQGDLINLEDEPLDQDACPQLCRDGADIRYADQPDPGTTYPEHLGIDDWHLESNRFGHYLVFDGSEEAARRLAVAVEESGLEVRRIDESERAADDGQFYDWFIRLGFDGTRDECLRRVEALFVDADPGLFEDAAGALDQKSEFDPDDAQKLAEAVVEFAAGAVDIEEAVELIESFGTGPVGSGYLAWRYAEMSTRPTYPPDGSIVGRLALMASIIRDDKQLLARLETGHGRFLESPHLTRRAIETEFDKIDFEASWWSTDDALRRARSSLAFLRNAIMLAFGSDDPSAMLLPKVPHLTPPDVSRLPHVPPHVTASVTALTRMIGLLIDLFERDADDLARLRRNGRAELYGLARGHFDYLEPLADNTADHSDREFGEQLGFVVLPPGELIRNFVAELRSAGSYRGGVVDLARLQVLEELEDYLEGWRCRLYRGAFSSSGNDNHYVVLGITRPGASEEDAVAISPWSGQHATFVVRHQCGAQLPWRSVLSRTKREAKKLGARRLVFTSKASHRLNVYEAMVDKLVTLLECDPADFDGCELYFDYKTRCYQLREPEDPTSFVAYNDEDADVPGASTSLIARIVRWFKE